MISITNQIELRHLIYFKMLAEELHYRRAAENLFISQSALSQQIKQLEEILKISLLERTNKKVLLTDARALFYRDTVQVLNKIESAVGNLRLYKTGNTGQLTIGFVASAMESILPKLLKQFNEDCPNIRFQLDELNNKEQLEALANETLDLGLSADMEVRCLYRETFSLVLPIDHPITVENFQHIGQLADEPFILFPNGQSPLYYQQIINLCADQGFTPRIVHRSIHAPTIFHLVANKMGLSIIPTSLATMINRNIRFIELKDIPQRTELFTVWKKDNNNPALPFLLNMLEAV